MSYRDDLEAAHARIEALEAQLGSAPGDIAETRKLVEKTVELERELSKVRDSLASLNAVHERLQDAMRRAPSSMPTLFEHNRSVPPGENALSGEPAGVRCPMCLLLCGESVEMRVSGNLRMMLWQRGTVGATNQTARCPRCDFLGVKFS
jgi:hypothetical protein